MKYFFTADEHYGHKNIIKFCKRPFSSIKEMDQKLIKQHNELVNKDDITIHAGDFAFRNRLSAKWYIDQLNGNHIFLIGSHDKWMQDKSKYQYIWEGMIEKKYIVICHYAMRTWARSHYNSWNLHGHCLDIKSEILTQNGWKSRKYLNTNDLVMTLNLNKNKLEYNKINEIFDYPNYNGIVFNLKSRGIDLRITNNHILIDVCRGRKTFPFYRKFYANNLNILNKRLFIKAGNIYNNKYNLTDDQIRFIVWIAAYGSLYNSNLIRIRILKKRKIIRLRKLLNRLSYQFKEHPHEKDGSISFNFNISEFYLKLGIKPLTNQIRFFNRDQMKILLEEYSYTDGCKNKQTIFVYTSKKQEADIIQEACVINGFMCNINERKNHGYAKKINYELCITNKLYRTHCNLKNKVIIEYIKNEYFWCVSTNNKTIFIRRNGKPIIVGNSHGKLYSVGKQLDIGVDTNNYYPYSWDQIKEIMKNKPDNPNRIK